MNFNFSNLSETNFSSNAGAYLKPYDIYKVNLTNIEKTEITGKDGTVYPVIAIEFTGTEGNKGIFSTNLFVPNRESDMERRTLKNSNGHESQVASNFENFQYTLMQIVHALNPAGEEKIKTNASKIKTIDQFIDLVIKALTGKNNIETSLKLVGRNNNGVIYASLPNPCGINKKGEIFATNFIGDNLFFSNYEQTQQKNYRNAKPTPVNDDKTEDSSGEDVDLDNLEL